MLEWLFPTYSSCIFCGKEDVSSLECGICENCLKTAPFAKETNATFYYDGKMETLIKNLKYHNKRYLATIFADLSKDKLNKIDYDMLCFVPSMNIKKRGYNQAELIARAIDNNRTAEVLIKIRDTVSQTTLSGKEREENVKGAFAVKDKAAVWNKRVLLVDDVYTTGSTVNECKKVLLEAGAKSVGIYTICKTKLKDKD